MVTWRLRQWAAVVVAACVVAGVGASLTAGVGGTTGGGTRPSLALGVTLMAVTLAAGVWSIGDKRVRRARSGAVGEKDMARWLRGFGTVVFGWRPPGVRYDIDVVVIEPCLAAVEVKRAEGRLRLRSDGTVVVGGVPIPGEPLRQAVRGAATVRRAIGTTELVAAVVCITGMRQRPRVWEWSGTLVVVCSGRHLRRVLRALEPSHSRSQARQIVSSLGGSWRE